ncbi:MAG: APC family permease [Chloroflexota bacterium]|nr:APC family permease [Chloroflexota bacterium]
MAAADAHTAGESPARHGEQLRRGISPRMLLFFVLGDILGAGIYIRVGSVAGEVGGAIWSAFLVALILAVFTAASYAELVTKYPGAGGAPLYCNRAFRKPFFTFLVAFAVLASGITSACVAARSFGSRYMASLLGVEIDDLTTALIGAAFILGIAAINFIGVNESVKTNIALTIVELGGLIIIIVIGAAAILGGGSQVDTGRPFTFAADANVALAILAGTAIAFYALIGFEDAVNMAEETHNPTRVFPRALFGGLLAAGVIYLIVSTIASAVVPTDTLAGNETGPLLEVVDQGPLGISPRIFSLIALIAITNTALLNMVMASRVVYGMARQGIIPDVLSRTHSSRRTPYVAIIFTTLLALALVTTSTVSDLADTTVMLLLIVFVIVNGTVLVLRRDAVDHPHFTTPTVLPVLGILSCLLVLFQVVRDDIANEGAKVVTLGAVLLGVGVVLYAIDRMIGGNREVSFDPSHLGG